jgi:hypothetical protein
MVFMNAAPAPGTQLTAVAAWCPMSALPGSNNDAGRHNRENDGIFGAPIVEPTSSSCKQVYSGCQKNVPIAGGFFWNTTYAAHLFPEHGYDKRYNAAFSAIFYFTQGHILVYIS